MSHDRILIYPNFGQRISTWSIDTIEGKYDLTLMKSTDSDSVMIYRNYKGDIYPVEYNYVKGKDIFGIGAKVAVSNEVSTYGKYVIGNITKIDNDIIEVVSMVNNEPRTYRISKYKQVSAKGESNQNDYVVVDIKREDKGELKLSYLFRDIGWSASYNMIVSDSKVKQFKLIANIYNNNENLKGNLTLIAGKVKSPVQKQRGMVMAQVSSQESSSDSREFSEYYRYDMGDTCIDNAKKLDVASCFNLDSQKYYLHDLSSNNHVTYGYRFKAPTFLPGGTVYIYTQEEGEIIYTGTSYIQEYREQDKVYVHIGQTTQIQVNTNLSQTNTKQEENGITINKTDISITTTVTNKT
jgi:hypothetical protein